MKHHLSLFRGIAIALVAIASVATFQEANARYVRPEIENVPLEQLVTNLTKQAEAKPEDAGIRFNLARAHAMAFANKTETLPVNQRQTDGGAWMGYGPRHVPFANQPTDDAEKQAAAEAQLKLAIAEYEKVLKLDPTHLSARLGYGWCLDQAGKSMQAIEQYRKAIEMGWEKEKDLGTAGLGWHSVVAEASGYLIPLLDADVDEQEITELQQRTKQLARVRRPVTPIAVPLREGLSVADLEDRNARVPFDADGSGHRRQWTWIANDAAWLVYDRQGTGQIDSAIQMFGSVTFWLFWDNGYQALAALDNNADGSLVGDELTGLALWHDRNSNGISEEGEVQSLSAHGITKVHCGSQTDKQHPDKIQFAPIGVTFADGSTRASYDILLHPADGDPSR